ncbi:hypothetical protein F9L33_10330 [Amylibacter sp. SFDW26]|uniref:hypothetical protein n=1 Tax=Amylibacter sp. SFDW26 TaxID=2652722 RepID=UPI0012614FEA|nr:hypothetical protein [Amylibacter sp. SFDW26]KAB7613759.1 hypothetical protein F9L33_10330 [Amylibacter sp. SFDW26]
MINLNKLEDKESFLEEQFVVSIQTPTKSVEEFAKMLGDNIELIQGNYSHCMYIRSNGHCRFKGNDGAHGGAEETIQEVPSAEIVVAIPHEVEMLQKLILVINKYHVHEEPTVHISSVFGLRSKYSSDSDNPNKYWNRKDAKEIHGEAIS